MEEGQTTQWPKDKWTNNDLQNITHKTKYRAIRTLLKTGGDLRIPGKVGSSGSTCSTSYYKPGDKSCMT